MPAERPQEEMAITHTALSDLPAIPESALELSTAVKLPIDQIPTLGIALSALPEAFRTTTTTITSDSGELLYRVTDAAGNILTPDMLQKFHDGTGLLGSVKTPDSFAQARLHAVDPQTITQTVSTTAQFNPAMIFVAAALAEVNQKLDAISDMQKEMFAYAKQRDHAELVSAFNVLNELRDNYRFNSDNSTYVGTRHQLVSSARQEAEKAIVLQRERLAAMLKPLGAIHMGKDVSKRTTDMVEALREYQLASYLYCYSTLMDVMLVGNYEPKYLESVSSKMERYSLEYFDIYGKCANRIEKDAKGSLEAVVVHGLGTAGGKLGNMIAATPLGDKTQIDEALVDSANAAKRFSRSGANKSVKALASAKPGFMRPFIDSIEELDRLHNEPVALAMDKESVYVIPLGQE